MLESFLEGVNYYDFPSLEVAIFSLLLAFTLSSAIALTYHFTFQGLHFPNYFFQAIVLSSIVTSMIIMSVGNNLAVGFGIIGAVAIIRFRTLVSDPRNIIFMFAGISVGITTGVYGYAVSIGGTLLFCVAAIMLRFSKYAKSEINLFEIVISYSKPIEFSLQEYLTPRFEINITSQRKLSDGSFKNEYLLLAKTQVSEEAIFKQLTLIEGLNELKVVRKKINTQL
ncbi:MAG: hypothetical protein CMB82_07840 [Flammeovirgaceae bacterium]|nr:hypothetical protein [Flammeovirgaceae bacterium]|tara:strand:+ start:1136 stop:1810 length:675 start_codon:yes stop_codon:yes gene_type:complete